MPRYKLIQGDDHFYAILWRQKIYKHYILIAIVGSVVQFILFKLLYPYADFFSDSYSYISAAALHREVSVWPIGYSKFMEFIHEITPSDTALVALQYALVVISMLYFFLSTLYFLSPSRKTSIVIFIFLFFNPLILYLCNYVSSDALFLAVSLAWFTQLVWIIYRPSLFGVFMNAILIAVAFTIRYNAAYYPFVAIVALLLSKTRWYLKVAGILFPFALVAFFMIYTREKAYELSGIRKFSAFSGWQLANNALYMFPHLPKEQYKVPAGCEQLHVGVKTYFDTIDARTADLAPVDGSVYIQLAYLPLKKYVFQFWEGRQPPNELAGWAAVSPTYAAYGTFLIKKYPGAFLRYYVMPNAVNYLYPPLEKLQLYNSGQNVVGPLAREWFRYKSEVARTYSKQMQGTVLFFLPTIFFLCNLFLLGGFIWLFVSGRGSLLNNPFKKYCVLAGAFALLNCLFSILASPVVLRYQVMPLILLFMLSALMIEVFERPDESYLIDRDVFRDNSIRNLEAEVV
ncbi:hypothetical protein [Chitinophaga sp. YIM B06452]|uniref:hypothetical protein n=1 Tax=Chitinophaga sp. YIM B06452 TaxID=3082158 RepID=UPI0031FEE2AC